MDTWVNESDRKIVNRKQWWHIVPDVNNHWSRFYISSVFQVFFSELECSPFSVRNVLTKRAVADLLRYLLAFPPPPSLRLHLFVLAAASPGPAGPRAPLRPAPPSTLASSPHRAAPPRPGRASHAAVGGSRERGGASPGCTVRMRGSGYAAAPLYLRLRGVA